MRAGVLTAGDDADIAKRVREAEASGLCALGPQRLGLEYLLKTGHRDATRLSEDEMFERLFSVPDAKQTLSSGGGYGHGSSDFPLILANAGNKAMISGYNMAPVTWNRWCKVGDLKNFHTATRLRLSEAPLLDEEPEGAPAAEGRFAEQGESIGLGTYGKAISYTRRMWINDDLGAFLDLLAKMGAAANYTVEVQVYTSLVSNSRSGPTMSDSVTLFHANHANLGTPGAPSQALLREMVTGMATQTGIGDDGSSVVVGAPPRYTLSGVSVAMEIESIVASPYAGSDARRDPQNKLIRAIDPIPVPQLDILLGANNDWYGVAPQTLAPSYEVAFLRGNRTPRTTRVVGTTVEGVRLIVRNDWGIFPTGGWQGVYRNAGA